MNIAISWVSTHDGARLPLYSFGGPGDAPALLFGHANGMAAQCYTPWLERLAARLNVFAFDARGHGLSEVPAGPVERLYSIDRMADDLADLTRAVAQRAGVARIAYCGHSLGAASALRLAAIGRAPKWRALIAFEPPIFPPPGTSAHDEAVVKQARLVAGTLTRRTRWASPDALAQRLKGTGLYVRYRDEMLAAHCRAILKPTPDGSFELRCPPSVESFIFRSHSEADTWSRLGAVALPIQLIGGDPATPDNDWVSSALADMAAALPEARLEILPGAGHLLIAEDPDWCARLVFDRLGVGSMPDSRAGHA
jgi:pimeloyl-ACP methyl ester carboxylesterase